MRRLRPDFRATYFREVCFGICLVNLLCLPLLAGCGASSGGSNGNSSTPGTTTTTGSSVGTAGNSTDGDTYANSYFAVSGTTATGLTASISTSSSMVPVGGTVTCLLILQNYTAAAIPVHATSTPVSMPAAELIVTGPNGAISFKSPPVPPPPYNGVLAPGQQIVSYVTANGFTTAGTYSVAATFSDDTSAPKSIGPLTITVQ